MTPAPATQLCPLHPEQPAVATCQRCGRFLCDGCRVSTEPPLCAVCVPIVKDPIGVLSAPFGVGTALKNGAQMFLPVMGSVAALTFVFSIPSALLSYFVSLKNDDSLRSTLNEVRLSSFFDSLIGIVCTVACLAMFIGIAEGKQLTVGQALAEATSRYGRVFGTRFRGGLWVGLLTLALILPGIWKAVMLGFSVEAAVRLRREDALEYSSSLVRGRWWEVFGTILAVWIIVYLPSTALSFGFEFAGGLVELGADSPARIGLFVIEDWMTRFSDQFVGACSLAMFYALVARNGLTLEPMRWRDTD